jgi:hypothetical protein
MMATEAVDARHEAILCLHRAILAIEQDDLHSAEMHTLAAVAWERDQDLGRVHHRRRPGP